MKNAKPKDPYKVVEATLDYIGLNLLEPTIMRDERLDPNNLCKHAKIRYKKLPFRDYDNLTFPHGVEEWLDYVFGEGMTHSAFLAGEAAKKSIMASVKLPRWTDLYRRKKVEKQLSTYANLSFSERFKVAFSPSRIEIRDAVSKDDIAKYMLWGEKSRRYIDKHNGHIDKYWIDEEGNYKSDFEYIPYL